MSLSQRGGLLLLLERVATDIPTRSCHEAARKGELQFALKSTIIEIGQKYE